MIASCQFCPSFRGHCLSPHSIPLIESPSLKKKFIWERGREECSLFSRSKGMAEWWQHENCFLRMAKIFARREKGSLCQKPFFALLRQNLPMDFFLIRPRNILPVSIHYKCLPRKESRVMLWPQDLQGSLLVIEWLSTRNLYRGWECLHCRSWHAKHALCRTQHTCDSRHLCNCELCVIYSQDITTVMSVFGCE